MKYTAYHEEQFRRMVSNAMVEVRKILDTTRAPKVAEEEDHSFDDKYALAEFLTNTSLASVMNVLHRMGLDGPKLAELYKIANEEHRSITLCFEAQESCSFLKEQQVDVVIKNNPQRSVDSTTNATSSGSTTSSFFSSTSQIISSRVTQKVREFHWKVQVRYRIFAYEGASKAVLMDLQGRSSSSTIVTTGPKQAPLPETTAHDPIQVSLNWLLHNITPSSDPSSPWTCNFRIDRTQAATPRRNEDTEIAIEFFHSIFGWSNAVRNFFLQRVERTILGKNRPANPSPSNNPNNLSSVTDSHVFCPVVPLLENTAAKTERDTGTIRSLLVLPAPSGGAAPTPLLSVGDVDLFLNEQCRSMDDALAGLNAVFPSAHLVKLITSAEAHLTLLSKVTMTTFRSYQQCIGYVEEMLRKQVAQAIGKEVTPSDFSNFMTHHQQRIFASPYKPTPFCFAVRRPNHYPDGLLSIECTSAASNSGESNDNEAAEPIHTHVRHIPGDSASPMSVPISASTSIQMTGDRYLHGWINHRFMIAPKPSYRLTARARQFSSFILVVGVLGGPDKFIPKDAIVLQNKDSVSIPLLLNELPTAKEFKDAIASLSREQQRFAKSYRSMQLESSVFGVCVVQIKPQMETLLGLPEGALTKEVRLTQDLMVLFSEYQIPSDLLAFDGEASASRAEKISEVREQVKSVLDVVKEEKQKQLDEMEAMAKLNIAKQFAEAAQRDAELEREEMEEESEDVLEVPPARGMMMMSAVAPAAQISYAGGGAVMGRPGGMRKKSQRPMNWQVQALSKRLDAGREESMVLQTPSSAPKGDSPTIEAPVDAPGGVKAEGFSSLDFTMIPKQLDAQFEKFDSDSSLRATIIKTDLPWSRSRQEGLLSKPSKSFLEEDPIKTEKEKAFDLLDALSRSGSMPIPCAELHVVIATTHCFENDVMGTVVQDNMNPIEKAEKTLLMVSSIIHGESAAQLLRDNADRVRLAGMFPPLLEG